MEETEVKGTAEVLLILVPWSAVEDTCGWECPLGVRITMDASEAKRDVGRRVLELVTVVVVADPVILPSSLSTDEVDDIDEGC